MWKGKKAKEAEKPKNADKPVIVEGFSFENGAEAAQAQKEVDGIRYIRTRTSRDDPQKLLAVYNKMVSQKLFETAVGYSYLQDMQEYLRSVPFIKNEDILPIPVVHPQFEASIRKGKKESETEKKLRTSVRVNVILALCIAVMFAITLTGSSPTIIDYRTKVVNQYAAWEQELNEREQAVLEREQELGISGQDE